MNMRAIVNSLSLAVVLGSATLGIPASAAAETGQQIWLHYDYMVMPDGTSLAPDPYSMELVVDAFAEHGIGLHIDRQHSVLPYHALLDFGGSVDWNDPRCAALGLTPADEVSFFALKAQYFHPTGNLPWHYAIFGDLSACNAEGGIAVMPGYDFVVSLGGRRRAGLPITPYVEGGMFMHELGHNLGLDHGGFEDVNWKSNYLSVMNYRFEFGIPYAASPGSTSVAGLRLDYSEEALPTLDEAHLDETRGIGANLPNDRTDITSWEYPTSCSACPFSGSASAAGPIDWNGDGTLETDVAVDIDLGLGKAPNEHEVGWDDWAHVHAYLAGQTRPGATELEAENPAER